MQPIYGWLGTGSNPWTNDLNFILILFAGVLTLILILWVAIRALILSTKSIKPGKKHSHNLSAGIASIFCALIIFMILSFILSFFT